MVPQDLPPEVAQYLGPAFTPLVAILWHVIGVPVCGLVLVCYAALDTAQAFKELGPAFGNLLVGLLTIALYLLLALAAGALSLFAGVGSTGAFLAAFCWPKRS